MNIIKYLAYVRVAELGNITKAAKELGYSQPGISHMLDALEDEFGIPLLIRSKDSITPTEAGEKILYYCNQIIKNEYLLRDTVNSLKGLSAGSIRIGGLYSTMVSFVPDLVYEFSKAYSNIEICLEEYSVTEIKDQLKNGKIDLAFTLNDIPKGFDFYPLFKDPICLLVNHQHPFASYDKIPISALNGCDFIVPHENWNDNDKVVLSKQPFSPNIKHYVTGDVAGIHMVAANLGVFITSQLQTNHLPPAVLAKKLDGDFFRIVGICAKSFKHVSPAAKEFINITKRTSEQWQANPPEWYTFEK